MAARAYGRQSRRRADTYGYETPGELIEEPWEITDWRYTYIPTINAGGGARRPVIYIAAPLPPGGLGGFGGFGGFGGGYGSVSPYGAF